MKKTTMFAGIAFGVGLVIVIIGNAMNRNRAPALRTESIREFGMCVCLIGLSTFLVANLSARHGKSIAHPKRLVLDWFNKNFTERQFINWVSVSGMILFGLIGGIWCFSIFTDAVRQLAGYGRISRIDLFFISIWPMACLMLVLLFLILFMMNRRLTVIEQRQHETQTSSSPPDHPA